MMIDRIKKVIRANLFAIISITVSAVILLVFLFTTEGIKGLTHILSSLQPFWFVLSLLSMAAYWLLEGYVLHLFCKKSYPQWTYAQSFRIGMIGLLYSAVTPFSTGGQPMQIYAMRKQGMDTGGAGSIIALKTLVYQVVMVAFAIILVIFQLPFFQAEVSNFSFLVIIGLLTNSTFIFLVMLFSLNRHLTDKIIKGFLHILHKLHIIKNPDERYEKMEEQLALFHDSARLGVKSKSMYYATASLTMVQIAIFSLIPYFIYRSFGFNNVSVLTMAAAQAFVTMVAAFVPLPGASGGAEGSFYLFFGMFFTQGTIFPAILLWRIITYYFNILFGCIFSYIRPGKGAAVLQPADTNE